MGPEDPFQPKALATPYSEFPQGKGSPSIQIAFIFQLDFGQMYPVGGMNLETQFLSSLVGQITLFKPVQDPFWGTNPILGWRDGLLAILSKVQAQGKGGISYHPNLVAVPLSCQILWVLNANFVQSPKGYAPKTTRI